jgi:hypothetical protein
MKLFMVCFDHTDPGLEEAIRDMPNKKLDLSV